MNGYRTIVADPPWSPSLGGTWGAKADKGRPQRFYDTLNLEQIKSMSVPAASQSHLYLWAITPHVDWGFEVARAWGFEPVTMLTWRKPGLGVGRFRCNTEHVIVARKGSRHGNPFGTGGRHVQATSGTVFDWPRGRHSEKPDQFFDLVERLSPGPRLELFARTARLGWERWGNEVDSTVEIEVVPTPAVSATDLERLARVQLSGLCVRDGCRAGDLPAEAETQEDERYEYRAVWADRDGCEIDMDSTGADSFPRYEDAEAQGQHLSCAGGPFSHVERRWVGPWLRAESPPPSAGTPDTGQRQRREMFDTFAPTEPTVDDLQRSPAEAGTQEDEE